MQLLRISFPAEHSTAAFLLYESYAFLNEYFLALKMQWLAAGSAKHNIWKLCFPFAACSW